MKMMKDLSHIGLICRFFAILLPALGYIIMMMQSGGISGVEIISLPFEHGLIFGVVFLCFEWIASTILNIIVLRSKE